MTNSFNHIRVATLLVILVVVGLMTLSPELLAVPGVSVARNVFGKCLRGTDYTVQGLAAVTVNSTELGVQGLTNIQAGIEISYQQGHLDAKTCEMVTHGAANIAESVVLDAEKVAVPTYVVARLAGLTPVAGAAGGVLSITGPIGIALLVGEFGASCIEESTEEEYGENGRMQRCIQREIDKLQRQGDECDSPNYWSDRAKQVAENSARMIKQGEMTQQEAVSKLAELQQEKEQSKRDCRRTQNAIKDALSVGYCGEVAPIVEAYDSYHGRPRGRERPNAPGLEDDYAVMRCNSLLRVYCNSDPRFALRRARVVERLQRMGVEYVHCDKPIATPTAYPFVGENDNFGGMPP